MIRFLRGKARLSVFGAVPEQCFNRWSSKNLPFWSLERKTELLYFCSAYSRDLYLLRQEAAKAQCEITLLSVSGLPHIVERLRHRSLLLAGLLAAVATVLFLQRYVWFIRVEGNQNIPETLILHALYEEGVRFGTPGSAVDSEYLKNRILNKISGLSWLAANRSGGILSVLCAERETEEQPFDLQGIANVIAARPGVIREIHVLNGFTEMKPNDTVNAGDILVSGVMEWTTHVQMTHARAEVFAETFRNLELRCPVIAWRKIYTGRTEICKSVIFQRNKRKISGNSSIFGTMCDRIVKTNTWILPGKYVLPVQIETVILREYVLEPFTISEMDAEQLLGGEALRQTELEMIAGIVEAQSTVIHKKENGYRCRAGLNCCELISVTVPVDPFGEEETYGKTDQR